MDRFGARGEVPGALEPGEKHTFLSCLDPRPDQSAARKTTLVTTERASSIASAAMMPLRLLR